MNYLSAEHISKHYGEKELFEDISIGIAKGQKAAIVGINGCGKSTLLKILAGVEPPDAGKVSYRKGITVRYLSQEPEVDPSLTVMDTVFLSDVPLLKTVREYQALLNDPTTDPDILQKAMSRMDDMKAWDLDARIREILGKLGIYDMHAKMSTLSGGQQKRVAMARALIEEPDLLLMDEPTNHLDLESIEWLEKYLASQNLSVVMVTHDRYFLDTVVDEIIEMEKGRIHRHQGDYEDFLEAKAEREQLEETTILRARSLFKKELEWLRRQPKARGTKAKARITSAHELKKVARQKVGSQELELKGSARRLGGTIVELHNVGKEYGDNLLFKNFDHKFKRGERVGIVGKNGSGKSTLLRIMTGDLKPDHGKVKIGDNTFFGHYRQEGLQFKPGQRVLDVVREVGDHVELSKSETISAADLLNLFLFPYWTHGKLVETLSGGEKRRLNLLRTLIQNPNFLILDEPTNDLDLITLNVLEDYLQKFKGCLVIVSHDRHFMNKLIDHLFVFEENGFIRDFPGHYGHYREWKEKQDKEDAKQKAASPAEKKQQSYKAPQEKKKLSFGEKREYEQLNEEIPNMESRIEELKELLNSGSTDHEELTKWGLELQELEADLDTKMDRWMELEEFA